jgi:peptidoglycan/xylan/chitin deacetylase (PgdA/CDA1 family)
MGIVTFLKHYRIFIIPIISAAFVIFIVVFIMRQSNAERTTMENANERWSIKQKETFSRLLKVPIILYHEIDGKGPFSVTFETLQSHFEYFKENNITIVPLSDLISRLDNPRPYEGRVLVITFDDGYKNMYKKLLPLNREYNYPITLFVYTDFVSEHGTKAITWDELREMQKGGIDIQCHTQSHADLVKLAVKDTEESRSKLFRELYLSRKKIELQLGKPVDLLAFPFGYYDTKTIQLAQFAGYRKVFSTDEGSNPVSYNNYCLRRHHIKNSFTLDTLSKIIE